MDELFVMQRYWGSDDEDNKGKNINEVSFYEKPKPLNEKHTISVVDLDSDDCMISNKKQKADSYTEIKSKDNKRNRQERDSSDSDCDIKVINDTKNSNSFKNAKSSKILNGAVSVPFKLKEKAAKKQKSTDGKLTKKIKENVSEENDVLYMGMNNNHSIENDKLNKNNLFEINDAEKEIHSKKEKKRRLRYFEAEENDNESVSKEGDYLNEKTTSVSKQKTIASHSQGTFDVGKEIKSKNKRSKLKEEEIDVNKDIVHLDLKKKDSEINYKKEKKSKVRYFDFEEIDIKSELEEEYQLNKKDKKTKDLLHKTADGNSTFKSENLKKLKAKSEEIDENDVDSEENNMDSENVGNAGQAFPIIGQTYQQKDEKIKHTLPDWLSNPTYISVNLQEKETPISELNYLDINTKNNLIKAGIQFLFPVQLAVIPWLMQSKEKSLLIRPSDICVSAPTGSGKTLAFVLPIVQSLKDRLVCAIRAVVVLPVSELAIQVYRVFETYIQGTDLKVALLTGKKSFIAEQNSLLKSTGHSVQSLVDIVVATPGRIHDHIYRTEGFCLKRLKYLVIDEADRMMEEIQQGWLKEVEDIVFHDCISSNCVCSSYKRTFYQPTSAYNFGFISQPLQKLLYSATLTHDPEQLHTLSLYKPKLFTASSVCSEKEYKGSCAIPSELKMLQVTCEEGVKPMVICHLIKHYNFKRVFCFTQTVERAHRLHLVLEEMGLLKVREISSFNRPQQRKIVLSQFCSGKIDILVCSDLVARGIDIKDIDCVVSYDIPLKDQIFIHRIGRTARAGKTGTAIALVSKGEMSHFKKILSANPEIKLPEKICINSEDLKSLVESFQQALSTADAKLKKEKSRLPGKSSKKTKRKQK